MAMSASPVQPFVERATSANIYDIKTVGPPPEGELQVTAEMMQTDYARSGDFYSLSMMAGQGWPVRDLHLARFLVLSSFGGLPSEGNGPPTALGYHSGHDHLHLLVGATSKTITANKGIPTAAYITDGCDGRTMGTPGMQHSLHWRNIATDGFVNLIHQLPGVRGVIYAVGCDKAVPAAMMSIASTKHLPAAIVPGGVNIPTGSKETTTTIHSLSARYAAGKATLKHVRETGCHACSEGGGSCQFLGTAATSQVVAEALGLAPWHSALAPSNQPVWLDVAERAALSVMGMKAKGIRADDILTDGAVRNAMAVFSAFGGSTNLCIHIPAVAHHAGLHVPTIDDWHRINSKVPRLVDVTPNGPEGHPTIRAYLAGGVPEVMLHLRELGLIDEGCQTVNGSTVGELLDWWQRCERRTTFRKLLHELDGVEPSRVIKSPKEALAAGFTGTLTFPTGNLAPGGSVIKSTAIDPNLLDQNGVYYIKGPARVFTLEKDAVDAVKAGRINPGDVIVLTCGGPMGTGMEETLQLTRALIDLPGGKQIAVITDARFSGVSSGACIGHVTPEALAGGPIGKVFEGDQIEIKIDTRKLEGTINLVGDNATSVLESRSPQRDLAPHPELHPNVRIWSKTITGVWDGCVQDPRLEDIVVAGKKALGL